MTAPTANLDAAARLGVPVTEIAEVLDSPAGVVIRRVDNVSYIEVPADRPDGEGKTGLMFLAAPTEKYTGSFPVYALPDETDAEPAKPAKPKPAAPADGDVSRVELVARAKELGLTINGRTKTENIAIAIAEKEAALAAAGTTDADTGDGDSDDQGTDDEGTDDGAGDGGDDSEDGE